MSPPTSTRPSLSGSAPAGRPAPRSETSPRGPAGSRPTPTLGGELRDSAVLFALALAVTAGAAAVARVLAGLTP